MLYLVFVVWGGVLINQKLTCSEDAGRGDEDVEMDLWTY